MAVLTKEQFYNTAEGKKYIQDNWDALVKPHEKSGYDPDNWDTAWAHYQKANPADPKPEPQKPISDGTKVVPGDANPKNPNEMNVVDYAGEIATDPSKFFNKDNPATPGNESMSLSDRTETIDPNTPGTNIDPGNYQAGNQSGVGANTATAGQAEQTVGNAAQSEAAKSEAALSDGAQVDQAAAAEAAQMDPNAGQVDQTGQAGVVDPRQTATVDVELTQDKVAAEDMEAAQGTVSDGAQVNADDIAIDVDAIAAGENGLGQALNDYAEQDLDAVDKKATVQGQLEELQSQFQDADGNPKIPAWAQGTARNVSKIAAFSGMTGTAATAAMAQAIMEASIPIAQTDAQFFQTLTIKNLDNKQESIINKANVLSKLELTNADSRLTAAIQNAQHFMQMDLANLSNEQQARVINNQNRVQSILEDAKAVNTARLFEAEQQNEMDKYYDSLNSSIEQFNVSQSNSMAQFNATKRQETEQQNALLRQQIEQLNTEMEQRTNEMNAQLEQNNNQFNAGQEQANNEANAKREQETNNLNAQLDQQMELQNTSEANRLAELNAQLETQVSLQNMEQVNSMKKFNREVENQRDQFYKTMQYNVDLANAKWRQEITLTENQQKFEAAATDVKNMVGIGLEQLNQIWDRSDSMLDYLWKSTENEAERQQRLVELKLEGQIQSKASSKAGIGAIFGTIAGSAAESFFSGFDWGW